MTTTQDKDRARREFSERLNAALDAIGFPSKGKGRQDDLGKAMGVTQKGARKWLEGEALPAEENREKLVQLCRVSYEWLFRGQGPRLSDTIDANTESPVNIVGQSYPAIRRSLRSPTQESKEILLKAVLDDLPDNLAPQARALIEQILAKSKSGKLTESALALLISTVTQLSGDK
ncbi:hypothetical protein [Acidithiobacillus sp.]